mmetsp:Transcript_133758/g.427650  ORF Transcript_133758/g.427650 Transcript_133758/m.427650 type:complete len:474 (-) Transcript_133758:359-1780(-)
MGGTSSKWITPGKTLKGGTTLVELSIPHIRDAHNIVGLQPEAFTPVVLAPQSSTEACCCFPVCWVQIPSGFSTVVTRCGADVKGPEEDGSWAPGGHCFMPWNRISRLVSRQWVIFDVPVKECRTKDWIWVNIDVLVVFEIKHASNFVYKLGPEKLDDMLRAHQEEFLRELVGNTMVKDIYDLRDADTDNWLEKMNKDFDKYGVLIHNITVRNVKIPSQMAQDFEDTTLYESKTVESQMKQESDRLNLNNEETLTKLRDECDNARMAAELGHVTSCAQITKEVQEVIANTEKTMEVLQAQRGADVEDLKVNGGYEQAKLLSEILSVRRETEAQMEVEEGKLEAEATAYEMQKSANAKMEASAKICEGKLAMATVEGEASEAFAARRQQDEELARLMILEFLGTNPNMKLVSSLENNTGLAPGNSLVSQIAQQGMEALRMKLAEATSISATRLDMGKVISGGLVRPVPQMTMTNK